MEDKHVPSKIHSDNPKVKKYISDAIRRDNQRKRRNRILWFKEHWIELAALVIAFISLVVSILK